MTRVLVVDGSQLMCWLVEQQVPPEVQVEHAATFSEAEQALKTHPPQAVIFNIAPGHLKWRLLVDLCRRQDPPIPFVCCSSLPDSPGLVVEVRCDRENAVAGPLPVSHLGECLRRLLGRSPSADAAPPALHDQLQ